MTISGSTISSYYDNYAGQQVKTGVNIRHRTIANFLIKAGLKPHHTVLEIGCGVGTLTSLIAPYVRRGSMLAVDISAESVEIARKKLSGFNHLKFQVSDMSDFTTELSFDFVILPDVLEHIPVEQHANLFKRLDACTKPDSTVFIHIPSPHYQDYIGMYKPELQQIIDQSLYPEQWVPAIAGGNFYIHSLITYGLGVEEGDYQRIILKKKHPFDHLTYFSRNRLIFMEICSRIRLWFT